MEMLAASAGRPQPNMQLIREDLVQIISQTQQIGIVAKVAGDAFGSDTSHSEEDDEAGDSQCIQEGSARIVWLNSKESTERVDDVRVLDRAFLHGDIVAAVADPLGQTGTVVDIGLSIDLELQSGEIVEGMDSRRLRRVRTFMPGDYVIQGNWLGRVEEVMDNVTVMFEGGAKCKIFRADTDCLVPIAGSLMDDSSSPYYPGQRVRGATPNVFKVAKWLEGKWKLNRNEGTVVGIEVGSVLVYWIASGNAFPGGTQSSAVPAMLQKPSALLPMTYFTYTNWQLGDWPFLPPGFDVTEANVAAGDEGHCRSDAANPPGHEHAGHGSPVDAKKMKAAPLALHNDVIADSLHVHRRKLTKHQRRAVKRERRAAMKGEHGAEFAALVVRTKTHVDVVWQDGTRSCIVDATSLVPVEYLGDHEFWPEQYVLNRGSDGEGLDTEVRRVGIVKSVNANQRTAVVRWLKRTEKPEDPREFECEEHVSVYEVVEHPHFNYCLGDVVIRLSPNPAKESEPGGPSKPPDQVQGPENESPEAASDEDEEEMDVAKRERGGAGRRRGRDGRSGGRRKCHAMDLSWVGHVVGLKDGGIKVVWADGNISMVGPQDIFVINREEEEVTMEASEFDISYGDDAASWETADFDECANREIVIEQGEISLRVRVEQPHETAQTTGDHDIDALERREEIVVESEPRPLTPPRENTVADAGPAVCGPRRYRGPIAACMRLMSRMAGALHMARAPPTTSLGMTTRSGLCCSKSGLEEILETHARDPRQVVNRMSSAGTNAKQILEGTFVGPALDDTVARAHARVACSHHVGKDASAFPPSSKSSRHASCDPEVTGLHSLLQPDGEHPESFVQPPSKHERVQLASIPPVKQFDCVRELLDHHFADVAQPNTQRKWVKKIQHEWSILEKNLPETIYVRVYEERMDLLRAVILGAKGTPYHDGLFVFDFHLPPEFPAAPPVAYYHSGGLRLNPNLYENGTVCLSLLNTWAGKGTEVWDPATSSLLQILVSMQGLVLNVKPYFNEAGYERQVGTPEGEKNSVLYNENAFLLSCKSVLYLLRRPPAHFEALVRQHFAQRGPGLLRACAAYMDGAVVGSLEEENTNPKGAAPAEKSSVGFRLMLAKLTAKLAAAFAQIDVDCGMLSPATVATADLELCC